MLLMPVGFTLAKVYEAFYSWTNNMFTKLLLVVKIFNKNLPRGDVIKQAGVNNAVFPWPPGNVHAQFHTD